MVRISEQLAAGHAPAEHSRRLRIRRATPVLVIDRIAYTYHDRPVELRRALYVTTDYHYHNELI